MSVDPTVSALQNSAIAIVEAGERFVNAATQAALQPGAANDATTHAVAAIIDTAAKTVSAAASTRIQPAAGLQPVRTRIEEARAAASMNLVGSTCAVTVNVAIVALALGPFAASNVSLLNSAVMSAAAIIGASYAASEGKSSMDGHLMGAMIGAALVSLVCGGAVLAGVSVSLSDAQRASALASFRKTIDLLAQASLQYSPPQLGGTGSSEAMERNVAMIRKLIAELRKSPPSPRMQVILPKLDLFAAALAAAAARLRA